MMYDLAKKTPDRKVDLCKCPQGHEWHELLFRYPPGNVPHIKGGYEYATNNGSTCPECGKQDILDH